MCILESRTGIRRCGCINFRRLGSKNAFSRAFSVGASAYYAGAGVFLDAWTVRIRLHTDYMSKRLFSKPFALGTVLFANRTVPFAFNNLEQFVTAADALRSLE